MFITCILLVSMMIVSSEMTLYNEVHAFCHADLKFDENVVCQLFCICWYLRE